MFAGKKSAQIREILISESAWEEMTCLFAPSLDVARVDTVNLPDKSIRWMLVRVSSTKFVLLVITI
ncbi:hypothetical protein DMW62_10450 [Serratia marcescens]|uniref:Uncharacterized protein n=1 Tax=Serratia marcescens TaxID=615 RepID=A0ABX5NEN1_SERMA|nr:hypothetical protein DMW42_03700 [Serratia marcescens]PYA18790.1 hypothetical protein DMW41_27420 [Serratia marcescens]PYA20295.1 hypothetical protein DMW40_27305 [Serratia marcescens]PYA39805.1 hypothetical protein DMW50_10190 [Serratia marcescens]PYA40251.1 hypothetical protein DMW44_06615 [Serratia marcescens]